MVSNHERSSWTKKLLEEEVSSRASPLGRSPSSRRGRGRAGRGQRRLPDPRRRRKYLSSGATRPIEELTDVDRRCGGSAVEARHPVDPQLISQVADGCAAGRRLPSPGLRRGARRRRGAFLCAIDHRTVRRAHLIDARALRGQRRALGTRCSEERRRPGLLSAASLSAVDPSGRGAFRIEGERSPVRKSGPRLAQPRGRLNQRTKDLDGASQRRQSRLGRSAGLIERLASSRPSATPAKKSYLFAKIAARRGWLEVGRPGRWEVVRTTS